MRYMLLTASYEEKQINYMALFCQKKRLSAKIQNIKVCEGLTF